mgnify:CR=1 FL=1
MKKTMLFGLEALDDFFRVLLVIHDAYVVDALEIHKGYLFGGKVFLDEEKDSTEETELEYITISELAENAEIALGKDYTQFELSDKIRFPLLRSYI